MWGASMENMARWRGRRYATSIVLSERTIWKRCIIMPTLPLIIPSARWDEPHCEEYLAARTDNTGVLILSEMAGAAKNYGRLWLSIPSKRGCCRSIAESADHEQRRTNLCKRANAGLPSYAYRKIGRGISCAHFGGHSGKIKSPLLPSNFNAAVIEELRDDF